MKSFKDLRDKDLTESGLSRIQKYWIEYDTGTITAFRGAEECGLGDTITKKQNKGRNGILQSKLLNRGYGVTRIKGSWFENAGKEKNESSFFVVDLKKSGKLKKDLINLGTDFDQDAIIYADKGSDYYGISTNKCPESEPGKGRIGVEEKFGIPKFDIFFITFDSKRVRGSSWALNASTLASFIAGHVYSAFRGLSETPEKKALF